MKKQLLILLGIIFCLTIEVNAQTNCALSGTYTIDKSQSTDGTNFQSFNDAISRLDTCGVSGSVVINVAEGTYFEQLNFRSIDGTSDTSAIVFQADPSNISEVKIQYFDLYSSTYIINMDSVSYITLKGFNISTSDTSSWDNGGVFINGSSDHITIEDSDLYAKSIASLIRSYASHCIIRDNRFFGTSNNGFGGAINIRGSFKSNNSRDSIFTVNGTVIKDNYIEGRISIYRQAYLLVKDNDMYGSVTIDEVFQTRLENNRIQTDGDVALELLELFGNSEKQNYIVNNEIVCRGGTAGIRTENIYYTKIYHNSILTTSPEAEAVQFDLGPNNTTFINKLYGYNRFVNNNVVSNGGYVISVAEPYDNYGTEYLIEVDYNNYYTTNDTLGIFEGEKIVDLWQWRLSTGLDYHSVDLDPFYVADTNLFARSLNLRKGKTIQGTTKDIKGVNRPSAPTIGAYEVINIDGECNAFSDFRLDSLEYSGFKANWVPGTNSSSFYLEYGPRDFTPGSASSTKVTGTYPGSQPPVYVSGLSANTEYDIYFGEICNSGNDTTWLNKVSITTPDSCPMVQSVDVISVGTDSISFSLNSFDDQFNIEWGLTGYKQGTGTNRTVGNNFTLDSLSENTTYDIYIRTNCYNESGGTSDWYGPVSFTTGCQGPLSGTYTIGGSIGERNFSSFRAAARALNNCGVSGAVVFNVEGGTGGRIYNEHFVLRDIPGISSENNVTFQAQSPLVNPVWIEYNAGTRPESNYIVKFTDASYITFKDMNFKATGTSSLANVVTFEGKGSNIALENNLLQGPQLSSAGNFRPQECLIISNGADYDHCLFSGNTFKYGLGAIVFVARLDAPNVGNVFRDNVIDGTIAGFYLEVQDSVVIEGNDFSTINGGLDLSGSNDVTISKNIVYPYPANSNPNFQGIILFGVNGGVISNNMITSRLWGMYMMGNHNLDIIYNSVLNQVGTVSPLANYSASCLFYFSNNNGGTRTSNIRILNNNFIAEGEQSLAIQIYGRNATEGIVRSDHNNFKADGEILGIWGTSTAIDLADWQSISNEDNNSISGDPLYISDTDLHVQSRLVSNNGFPVPTVTTTDIDDEERSDDHPDIGADEFELSGCYPSIDFKAIKTFGDSIRLSWKPGAGQAFSIEYGSSGFSPGNGTWVTGITDSVYTVYGLNPQTSYDFYLMDYCGASDTSIWIGPLSITTPCSHANLLSGAYTIDSSQATGGRNFGTFTEVASVLNNCGIKGPVVFHVVEGTYNEQIELIDVYGVSRENTITFQPDSSNVLPVYLTHRASRSRNFTFRLTDMQYVTIQGLVLFTDTTVTNYGNVISFTGDNEYITIENNKVIGTKLGSGQRGSDQSVIVNDDNKENRANHVFIRNNEIYNGSNSIYWLGDRYGGGLEVNLHVENNTIKNFSGSGFQSTYQDSLIISDNVIISGGKTGLMLKDNMSFKVERNRIKGLDDEGISISYYNGDGDDKPSEVSNNIVSMESGDGISLSGTKVTHLDILYNSVYIHSGNGYCIQIDGAHLNILNNNFVHNGNGYIVRGNAQGVVMDYNNLYYNGGGINFYYGFNGNRVDIEKLSEWYSRTGFDVHSVSADPLFTSLDSLYANSPLINDKGIVLTDVTSDIDGQNRSSFTPDIGANEFTPVGEDILINEVIQPITGSCGDRSEMLLVKIGNVGNNPVSGFTVNVDISGSVQANLLTTYSGTLNSGETDTVELSPFNSVFADTIHIKAYVDYSADQQRSNDTIEVTRYINPAEILEPTIARGFICEAGVYDTLYFPDIEDELVWLTTTGDTLSSNDSLVVGPLAAKDTTFILSAQTGCYAGDARLKIKYQTKPIADFTSNLLSAEIDKRTVEFDAGTSQEGHTYYWDFGDGNIAMGETVSHDYTSNGNYDVRLITEGNCGRDTIIKTVVISGISLEENILSKSLEVYPNPTTDKVYLSFETHSSKNVQLQLTDLSGKVILQKTITNSNGTYKGELSLEHLAKGSYMLRVESGELNTIKKIIRQ